MPDTGFVIAGQGRAVNRAGGSAAWTNPGNIVADDASNAGLTQFVSSSSHWLVADTFDFSSIPNGSTIDGIEVRAQLSVNTSFNSRFSHVNIGKADATLGTQKTPATVVTTTPTNYDNGGAADLWGLTISAAEVKTSTFQALIACQNLDGVTSRTFSCDAIWMRVTYTAPVSGALIYNPNPLLPLLVR